ncbi:MAG: PD-(D/E)XK nuclease family protein [Firmicutes bacterium]|nr:PD-(D/E)XK nuclease family protein [Bacillota bacterium]
MADILQVTLPVNTPAVFHRPSDFIKDAIFLSHSSLSDFQKCRRAYYLKNVYRDGVHGYKLLITSPYLSLGSLVHDTIHWYFTRSENPTPEQTIRQFRLFWGKFRGKRGGFTTVEDEAVFGKRGLSMLDNFLKNTAVLGQGMPTASFPNFTIEDNLVFTGNMDYVEKLPDGSLHVVDFKTGAKDEDGPTQLYLYALMAENFYRRPVKKASFWYLDRESAPREVVLESREQTFRWLLERARQVKEAWQENKWVCTHPNPPCRDCRDYEAILEGKGEFMFTDERYKKEVYFLDRSESAQVVSADNGTSAKVL